MKTIKNQLDLTNRVALITGAGGHLGGIIAETLAELGANLLLLDKDPGKTKAVTEEIQQKFSVVAIPMVIDLEKQNFSEIILATIKKEFGQLDILINNAAFVGSSNLKGWITDFQQQEVGTWRRALEVNLTAPFVLSQACAEFLKLSKKGSVINIGSIYGVVGPDFGLYENTKMGNPAAYAASKGGLIQLTRWLASALAPNVRVNAVSPGGIFHDQPESFCNRYIKKTLLQRMAYGEDLKGTIAYLASDLSSYVTGQNLLVDGGFTVM